MKKLKAIHCIKCGILVGYRERFDVDILCVNCGQDILAFGVKMDSYFDKVKNAIFVKGKVEYKFALVENALNALMLLENRIVNRELKWTKGAPAKDGYYWCRIDKDDLEPIIAKVSAEGQIAYECGCENGLHDLAAYEWYGPIEPPEYH